MFDVGWTELLVIAVVAIVVVGPKDLPRLLRTVGNMVGKLRRMSGDFQRQFNAALKEAEREVDIADAKETVTKTVGEVRRSMVNPLREMNPLKAGTTGAVGKAPAPKPIAAAQPAAATSPMPAEAIEPPAGPPVAAPAAPARAAKAPAAAAPAAPAEAVMTPLPTPPDAPVAKKPRKSRAASARTPAQ
jgi:sec-independent protein translocase protein TatB